MDEDPVVAARVTMGFVAMVAVVSFVLGALAGSGAMIVVVGWFGWPGS